MLKRLLVPLDGAEAAETLLPTIRRFVEMGTSEVTLLRTELPVAVDEYAVVSEALLDEANAFLAGVRERLSGLKASVRAMSRIGPPVATVLEAAEETRATMIVAALARRTRLARFLFGNVTERLVQRSRLPVLSVPPPWSYDLAPAPAPEGRTLRSVLVPLDGGEASRTIMPFALDFARAAQAKLLLTSVIPSRHPASEEFSDVEQLLYGASVDCAEAGVDFSVVVESGDPVERILTVCRDREVDGIAMSTRGRSGLLRWISPSATLHVLRQTWLPTLTVRSAPAARAVGLGAPHALGRH
jgi:nucleotide-binding universal stress UspA family protein